jgi:glycosyltransferase involved in cell wall biosynthesis
MAGFNRAGKPPVHIERLLWAWPHRPLLRALANADVVLVSPPYHFGWVRRHTPRSIPVVFDEHSIESHLYADPDSWLGRAIAREVERSERRALQDADLVFVTSHEDGELARAWGASRVALVPNGVDIDHFHPASQKDKSALRRRLGLPVEGKIGVFVGSGHPPNVDAVTVLERDVQAYRDAGIHVVVVGRCGLGRGPVPGVSHLGEVSDVAPYMQAADLALCPLRSGSGTSLKMIEYLAAGLPVVSTEVGIRGLELRAGSDIEVCTDAEMPARSAALASDRSAMERLGRAGRLAAERFSWHAIGRTATTLLDELVGANDATTGDRAGRRSATKRRV